MTLKESFLDALYQFAEQSMSNEMNQSLKKFLIATPKIDDNLKFLLKLWIWSKVSNV
jgi:hypothetical protein